MEQEILELLSNAMPEIDFRTSKPFMDERILDSVSLATIIAELSDRYQVTISYDMITPENFNSIAAIAQLVKCLRGN